MPPGTDIAPREECEVAAGRSVPHLRLAITVDPEIPVPPRLYGGIERIVDMLVRGLVQRGHAVTLFAHPDSHVPCRLLPYPRLHSRRTSDTLANMRHVSSAIARGGFDLVHSFARLAYLTPLLPRPIPKIMSYGRAVAPSSVRLGDLPLPWHPAFHWLQCAAYTPMGVAPQLPRYLQRRASQLHPCGPCKLRRSARLPWTS